MSSTDATLSSASGPISIDVDTTNADYVRRLVDYGIDLEISREVAAKTVRTKPTTRGRADVSLGNNRTNKSKAPTTAELIEKTRQRAGAYDNPRAVYQLPLWPSTLDVRAIPNHFARSCLFAPIGRGGPKAGTRKVHTKPIAIASRGDVLIKYKGPQLDMADCDVFMQALEIARKAPLGEPVFFIRREFLASLKKSDAGPWYKWLDDSIDRLLEGTLYIETKRYVVGDPDSFEGDAANGVLPHGQHPESASEAGHRRRSRKGGLHLICGYDYDEAEDSYYLMFDPRVLALFQNHEFALVDWERRFQISRRVDLAKWLQNYSASHEAGVHTISLKLLKEWSGYSSPPNKFKLAIHEALTELERLGVVSNARIRPDGKVTWFRARPCATP